MLKKIFQLLLLAILFLCSCSVNSLKNSRFLQTQPVHTKEALHEIKMLKKVANRKTPLFGHQDDLLYGQSWFINERDTLYKKSDVYDVCGSYPYILGIDLGRIENDGDKNIDGCLFRQMKEAAITHHKRGGIITISWHMDNPQTGGSSWDCSGNNVVRSILNDSILQKKYLSWLDKGLFFLNQLVDDNGRLIPVLFRPFHECNMDGFWWSGKTCSDDEYISLWKLTYDYLVKEKKMNQLLWVYSPYDIKSEKELEFRYPGDEYVDVIGYERYQIGAATYEEGAKRFANGVSKGLDLTIDFAKPRKKVVAMTETGFPGIPYDTWWTEALGKAINNKRIAYIHVWRNGKSENYYFGPCAKSSANMDFFKMVKGNKIKLLPHQ